jgi:hypothetical protein
MAEKFVMVKTHHDVQICAVKSEKVSCTKMSYFENWLLKYVQHGEVDNLTNGGKNLSWSNVIIAVRNLQYVRGKR